MSETVIYGVSVVLLIGVFGLGFWFLRQSLGMEGMPLFAPKQRRRLGLVESTAIDGRRRLLLIRRDNVEHLILTGGPVDMVVETGIAYAPRPSIIGLDQQPLGSTLNGPAFNGPAFNGPLNGHEPQQASLEEAPIPLVREAS
jgi:flagellar protein FliO/FliZ